jgi:hypothetical protein
VHGQSFVSQVVFGFANIYATRAIQNNEQAFLGVQGFLDPSFCLYRPGGIRNHLSIKQNSFVSYDQRSVESRLAERNRSRIEFAVYP